MSDFDYLEAPMFIIAEDFAKWLNATPAKVPALSALNQSRQRHGYHTP
jgi:hypothetical protein